ncbi:MAG: NfeD family protein [Bacteroidota bacterium]|nr:NfeD family protein [Bacteroidota bacterium]
MGLIITLIVVGLIFLLLEVLVIPGITIAGIIGSVLIVVGIWYSYTEFGNKIGIIVLGSTVFITIISLYFALKGNTWKKMMLTSSIVSKVEHFDDYKPLVGDEGITISRLNPIGKVRFKDDYFEAKSTVGYINPSTKVIITKIEHNEIIVKPKEI